MFKKQFNSAILLQFLYSNNPTNKKRHGYGCNGLESQPEVEKLLCKPRYYEIENLSYRKCEANRPLHL